MSSSVENDVSSGTSPKVMVLPDASVPGLADLLDSARRRSGTVRHHNRVSVFVAGAEAHYSVNMSG